MNKELKIYLAGKMSGLDFDDMNEWRATLKKRLNTRAKDYGYTLLVINPVDFYNFAEKKHKSEEEIEDFDLMHVTTSDIIIVNLEGLSTSDGTKYELHDANYHKRIPVIAFGEMGLYEVLHPWIKRDITRVEPDVESLIDYLEEFYFVN